ncbi:MAG: energy transducer TonB [Cytophagaceae bacterium]|nr:energy transducer TonB [Cytophagaceae bacterium]
MRFTVLLLLLIRVALPVFSQSPSYEAFEVDSAAHPKGGMNTLALFVQTNLRPPVAALAAGLKGRVYVQGVVNPDGRMSDLTVVRGLRPDCDREALRVLALFGAWQPALKNRQVVRQKVSVPVDFRFAPVLWAYKDGQKIEYIGENDQLVSDEKLAVYQVITPIDSSGNLTGDVIIYKPNESRKPVATNKLTRTFIKTIGGEAAPEDSAQFVRVALVGQNKALLGEVRHFHKTGELYSVATYAQGRPVGETKYYYKNGAVSEWLTYSTNNPNEYDLLRWYANGQIRQGLSVAWQDGQRQEKLTSFWLPNGQLMVSQGTGQFKDSTEFHSERILETGRYLNGIKDGHWEATRTNGQSLLPRRIQCRKIT